MSRRERRPHFRQPTRREMEKQAIKEGLKSYDIDHYDLSWAERLRVIEGLDKLDPQQDEITRQDLIDEYQQGVKPTDRGENRRAGGKKGAEERQARRQYEQEKKERVKRLAKELGVEPPHELGVEPPHKKRRWPFG